MSEVVTNSLKNSMTYHDKCFILIHAKSTLLNVSSVRGDSGIQFVSILRFYHPLCSRLSLYHPTTMWGRGRAWRILYLLPSHLSLEVTHTPSTHIPLERTSHVQGELGKQSLAGQPAPSNSSTLSNRKPNIWWSANHLFQQNLLTHFITS